MLTAAHDRGPLDRALAPEAGPGRLQVLTREHPEPEDGAPAAARVLDLDQPPAVAVPADGAELAERLGEALADATDPEAWEAVLAGAAALAGDPAAAAAAAPLVGRAREGLARGEAGIWYLEPEHDAARIALALAGRPVSRRAPTWGWSDHRRSRTDEVLDAVVAGRPAILVATPTGPGGALDADVVAERIARAAGGARHVDVHQARLRVARRLPAVAPTWSVRAERGRQGTLLTLDESPSPLRTRIPAARGDRLSWHGMANPVPAGSQRVPTREADLLRWASPHERDRLDAWAAERLARNIDWWEADWEERRLFARLRTTQHAPGLPGRVLLAVGLATKQASAHQPAVAVTRRLLDAGLLGPRRFGDTVARVAGVLDPGRLARTFGALRATHPAAVVAVLDAALPGFVPDQRGVAALVELYADLAEAGGTPGASAALRAWLASVPRGSAVAAAAGRALAAPGA